jgi:hypothetical protein
VASTLPQDQDRPVTRWTLEEIVATWLDALHTETVSRSRVWRLLHDVDRKPHTSAYWLNRHDADFDAKAHPICQRYAKALACDQQGRVGVCGDEKTGRQVLDRQAPTTPAQPGRRERRAHADSRHGTRVRITALAVATGQWAWPLGATRQAPAFVAPLTQADQSVPRMTRDDWVRDNFKTPWRLDVCRWVARWGKGPFEPHTLKRGPQRRAFLRDPSHCHGFHCTPKHGAWRKQAA